MKVFVTIIVIILGILLVWFSIKTLIDIIKLSKERKANKNDSNGRNQKTTKDEQRNK